MKKLTAFILSLIMLVAMVPVSADEAAEQQIPARVEISFRVGDETLMINGTPVTVEKPYVVGVGVTLVPLRVITEAFGAKVEWIAETKSITLEYPDVDILLQINNPIAEVNGKAQELLSAPELTPTGFTMVPLRFISETFGATVSYDDATKSIVVIKEAATGEGEIVSGGISEKYIGDSFYGWSMENSSDLVMDDREFDGSLTTFGYKENIIEVYVDPVYDEYDFEKDFIEYKTSYSAGNTLVKADKNSEAKTMHFQFRNDKGFFEDKIYVTDKYIYSIYSVCGTDAAIRDEILALTSTFALTYPAEDVYDLSNIKDGMRVYTSESLNYEVSVPDSFALSKEDGIGNSIVFNDPETGGLEGMNVSIYSKSDVGSAKEFCETIYKQCEYFNENIFSPDKISEKTYGDRKVYEFNYTIDSSFMSIFGKDVCFEIGDYVYNVGIMVENNADANPTMEKVISSFKAEPLDPTEVGILMYDTGSDSEEKFTIKGTGWSLRAPYSYIEASKSDMGATIVNRDTAVIYQLSITTPPVYTQGSLTLSDFSQNLQDSLINAGYELESTDFVTIGGKKFADMTFSYEEDGEMKIYQQCLVAYDGSKLYVMYAIYTEVYYSEYSRNEIREIINSFKPE